MTKQKTIKRAKKAEEEDICLDLEKLFDNIEKSKAFREWFGTPCKSFSPLCFQCKFWAKWNLFKAEIFEEMV